jgi:hypothetical protein
MTPETLRHVCREFIADFAAAHDMPALAAAELFQEGDGDLTAHTVFTATSTMRTIARLVQVNVTMRDRRHITGSIWASVSIDLLGLDGEWSEHKHRTVYYIALNRDGLYRAYIQAE